MKINNYHSSEFGNYVQGEDYEKWIANYKQGKLLIIDVNNLDFVEHQEDYSTIVGRIDLELNSLFS